MSNTSHVDDEEEEDDPLELGEDEGDEVANEEDLNADHGEEEEEEEEHLAQPEAEEDDEDYVDDDALYEEDMQVSPPTAPMAKEEAKVIAPLDVKKKKKSKWTNDFDSAATFQDYLKRLAPVTIQASPEKQYVKEMSQALPVALDMVMRRGFILTQNASVDAQTLVVSIEGVAISPVPAIETPNEDFFGQASERKHHILIRSATSIDGKICLVMFVGVKMCVQAARDIGSMQSVNPKLDSLVIVTGGGATPIASKTLMQSSSIFYQIFKTKELLLPFVDHDLNPSHRVFTTSERDEFYKRKMVPDASKMPILPENDAYAKFYGLRTGQLVEFITRYGGCIGDASSYRVVGVI